MRFRAESLHFMKFDFSIYGTRSLLKSNMAIRNEDDALGVIKMRPKAATHTLLIAIIFTTLASADVNAAQWCGGVIKSILITSNGEVHILTSYRNDWTQICNTTTSWKGVAPDLCKSWLSVATALRLAKESALVFYNEDTPCIAIPSYGNSPAPAYFSIATY